MKKHNLKYKLIASTLLSLISIASLTGCGMTAEEKEVVEMISSVNPDIVMQSYIVNPYALINAFNTDLDRALNNFNGKTLAIKISPNQLINGQIVMPNADGTQNTEQGTYVQFDEAGYLQDNTEREDYIDKHPSRTSLICSVDNEDYRLLNYANGTEYGTQVTTYYLIGRLSAIVGNESYNLFMKDCRLMPAPTLQPVPGLPQEPDVKQNSVLDVTSSETITSTVTTTVFGVFDFDENGQMDALNVAVQNSSPSSGFQKVIDNCITKKITTDLSSIMEIKYNDKKYGFKIPYPVSISNPVVIPSSGIEGQNVKVLTFLAEGKDKTQVLYKDNKELFKAALPALVNNPIYMDTQTEFLAVGKNGIQPFTINLLDGTQTTSIASDKIYFKNIKIDGIGNITGDIFVKTDIPFTHYYNSAFRIVNETTVEEVHIDKHEIYDAAYFEDNDILQPMQDGFKLKKDIALATSKKLFVSYKLDKTKGNLLTGKGTTKNEEVIDIIKGSTGDYINFLSIEKVDDQYWINAEYLYNDGKEELSKKTVFIPIKMANDFNSSDRNVEIVNTSYKIDDLFYFGK